MSQRMNTLIDMCTAAVLLVSLFAQTLASNKTDWYGLGVNECFGRTCKFGQYCSKATFLGGHCRDCDEMTVWCHTDREHLKTKMPSCFYICLRQDGGLDWRHYVLITILAVVLTVGLLVFIYTRKRRNPCCRLRKMPDAQDPERVDLDVRPEADMRRLDPEATERLVAAEPTIAINYMTDNDTAHINDDVSAGYNDSGRSSFEDVRVPTQNTSTSDCPSPLRPHSPTQAIDELAAVITLHD
ncbi:hypothetical protein BaRGS_00018652 [Batillaria attramentaria]|uniref:Uncharacterized protein n=1 Tax=Batillaria attramentaria TaxID=370345 RepID=A0ABD0KSK2_9CAEN